MKVELKKPKKLVKTYKKQEFEIKPYITLDEKAEILTRAYESYLNRIEESGGLIEAISGMDADVQVLVMLYSVPGLELPENVTYEELLESGFLYFVLNEVVNYQDIRNSVHDLVRLFVISERIPDINQMANAAIPGNQAGIDKEAIETMTELVKEMQDS